MQTVAAHGANGVPTARQTSKRAAPAATSGRRQGCGSPDGLSASVTEPFLGDQVELKFLDNPRVRGNQFEYGSRTGRSIVPGLTLVDAGGGTLGKSRSPIRVGTIFVEDSIHTAKEVPDALHHVLDVRQVYRVAGQFNQCPISGVAVAKCDR